MYRQLLTQYMKTRPAGMLHPLGFSLTNGCNGDVLLQADAAAGGTRTSESVAMVNEDEKHYTCAL